MEGGAEQTTAAVAKIGQHQRNVAAQGEIPAQGKRTLQYFTTQRSEEGEKRTDFIICDCPIPDLNSFSFCWVWDTPLLQAVRAYAAMVKACVG